MVLRLRQHNIGYTADGFYRSDDPTLPTNSVGSSDLSLCNHRIASSIFHQLSSFTAHASFFDIHAVSYSVWTLQMMLLCEETI